MASPHANQSPSARRAQLPRLRHDVDDRWLATSNDLDGPVKCGAELIRLRNRAEAFDTQGARHRGEVWRRVFEVNPDALIVHWALPPHGHPFLILLVVVVRT